MNGKTHNSAQWEHALSFVPSNFCSFLELKFRLGVFVEKIVSQIRTGCILSPLSLEDALFFNTPWAPCLSLTVLHFTVPAKHNMFIGTSRDFWNGGAFRWRDESEWHVNIIWTISDQSLTSAGVVKCTDRKHTLALFSKFYVLGITLPCWTVCCLRPVNKLTIGDKFKYIFATISACFKWNWSFFSP